MEKNDNDIVLILKNAGNSCNIGCRYCAEARKKSLNTTDISTISLSDIEKLIERTKSVENLTVLFHGGEPLIMGIDYYKTIISMWRKSRKDVYFGIQTNATLVDSEWLDFFEENKEVLGISVSLDGDEQANAYRVDKDGNFTFQRVTKALESIKERGIQTGLISTLTQASIGRERELFDTVSKFPNIRFLKLNPCYDIWKDGVIPEWAITPDEYVDFVINFFNIMIEEQYMRKLNVEPILSIIKGIKGIDNSFCNFCDKKCNHFFSIYPDGKAIACDNFDLSDGLYPDWREEDDIWSVLKKRPKELFDQLDALLTDCKECSFFSVCHGGCLAARRRYKLYGKNDECRMYCHEMRRLINYIKKCIEGVYQ